MFLLFDAVLSGQFFFVNACSPSGLDRHSLSSERGARRLFCHIVCGCIEVTESFQDPFNTWALQSGITPHATANDTRFRSTAAKPGQKTSMGSSATRGNNEHIEILILFKKLRGRVNIAKGSKRWVRLR